MRVLIACEFSGIVREAFRKRGHDAWSCDLLPTEIPGNHIQGDVLNWLNDGWDMMIAHPPCTYLSKAGARWLYQNNEINEARYKKGVEAKCFFLELYNAPIDKICIENPTPLKIFELPVPTHSINPFEFGENYSKRTLLWLRNLPPLLPTLHMVSYVPFLPSNTGGKERGQSYRYKNISSKESSKTFKGIAEAMANQWGSLRK